MLLLPERLLEIASKLIVNLLQATEVVALEHDLGEHLHLMLTLQVALSVLPESIEQSAGLLDFLLELTEFFINQLDALRLDFSPASLG